MIFPISLFVSLLAVAPVYSAPIFGGAGIDSAGLVARDISNHLISRSPEPMPLPKGHSGKGRSSKGKGSKPKGTRGTTLNNSRCRIVGSAYCLRNAMQDIFNTAGDALNPLRHPRRSIDDEPELVARTLFDESEHIEARYIDEIEMEARSLEEPELETRDVEDLVDLDARDFEEEF